MPTVIDGNTGVNKVQNGALTTANLPSQLSVNASAAAGSIAADASGRVTMPYQPAFLASGTGGWQTVAANAPVPFNTLSFSVGSHFNVSTHAFTAPVSGRYLVACNLYCGNGTSSASFYVTVNGTFVSSSGGDAIVWDEAGMTGNRAATPTLVMNLSAGDSVQIRSRNTQSSAVYLPHSIFSGYLIG
jgi:hypothetical protein